MFDVNKPLFDNSRLWKCPINVERLSTMISHAVAPAFLLGAVAALVSILIGAGQG